MEETSLEDFLDADDGDGETEADANDDGETEADADDLARPVDPATVEAAIATATWSPEGVACHSCGEPVQRRWTAGDAFVCADCLEW